MDISPVDFSTFSQKKLSIFSKRKYYF